MAYRPDTTGIRKCNATVMKTPRKKAKVQKGARSMPCGKKAVVTYRLTTTWSNRMGEHSETRPYHFCEDCQPLEDTVGAVVRALNTRRLWGTPSSVSRMDEVLDQKGQRILEVTNGLVNYMGSKSGDTLSKEDWMKACEDAWEEFATRSVING